MTTTGPDAYPVAYCAPGSRLAAALTLMLKGEQVARIEEHARLEGKTDVIVVSEPPRLPSAMSALLEFRPILPVPPWRPITGV